MGFHKGAYATIWSVEPVSDTFTNARISISHKDKQTEKYVTDFSGFICFVGTAAAKKAACLKEKDRICLGDVDITTKRDEEKSITYTNFKVFSFETQEKTNNSNQQTALQEPQSPVDDGEVDDSRLPF